ncbi:MAG: YihY/virulence factor BrkB family protein [Bacteroidota bacterium]|nr:YihY/virulence factor BrkB family protein [Bacteroidota bacterium]
MAKNRGKQADKPGEIPAAGWKDILLRVKDQLDQDNIEIIAAGVAFYFFLALFPSLAALVSIYGLVMDPAQVTEQMDQLTSVLPEQAHNTLHDILQNIVQSSSDTLGWALALGLVLSLWSANKGTKSLFEGVNIAYDEENKRGFIRQNALSLLFTLGAIIVGIISITLIAGFPAFVDNLGLPETLKTIIGWTRWLILAVIVMFSFSLIYQYAPLRDDAKFRWVSWGAAIATIFWIGGSLLFSFYVTNFGSYNETYGSVAAIIILLLWLNLTCFIILLGAEINSELEHQTAKDTTKGADKPMGQRGAYHADHVAE